MKKKKKWKKKRGSSVRIQGRDIRGFHSQIYIYIRNTKKTAVDHEGSLVSQILRDSVWHVRFTHLNSDAWLWFFFFLFIENAGRGGQQPPTNQAVIIIRLRRALTYYYYYYLKTSLPPFKDEVANVFRCGFTLFFTNATPETTQTHTQRKKRDPVQTGTGSRHEK